jgi:hypothetical protein
MYYLFSTLIFQEQSLVAELTLGDWVCQEEQEDHCPGDRTT